MRTFGLPYYTPLPELFSGFIAQSMAVPSIRIYVDQRPVFLRKGKRTDADLAWTRTHPAIYYSRRGDVKRALWLMEHDHLFDSLTIYGKDLGRVRDYVFRMFKVIHAAGGLVRNHQGEILMIRRKGKWDLPKGKLDPGEKPAQAALREVAEETGVSDLVAGPKLLETFHVYTERKVRVLKCTHWFIMDSTGQSLLKPQLEEQISQVEWTPTGALSERLSQTYPNILDVFQAAGLLELETHLEET
jgi:8-oxo-dGTP pyrophosphatase MutT (NUDIX family)